METEQLEEILKTVGDRKLDPPCVMFSNPSIGGVIDDLDKLPDFARVPVAKAYSALYQLYDESTRYINAETEDMLSYCTNIVRNALGKPRRWFVYIRQFDRPHNHILCDVVPFGTHLDDFFKDVEKREKSRDRASFPSIVDNGHGEKFRLVEDLHMSNYRFGNCRRLVYEEVVNTERTVSVV